MIDSVTHGRAGTAMKSFAHTLTAGEIETVVDFVRKEFMQDKAPNTRYHTAENGWPDHDRYAVAFPFALGKIAIDTPDTSLTPQQREGKKLFMSSCVTCHDRARVNDEGVIWDHQADSYPRNDITPEKLAQQLSAGHTVQGARPDSSSGATPYSVHEAVPVINDLTPQEREGEALFQKNCAFCHAADGTGKNWIGSFLQPHPRNLTDAAIMSGMTREHVRQVILEGLKGTTMSAWKSVLSDDQIDSVIAYIQRAFHALASD